MYLPRKHISLLYEDLFKKHHPMAPQVLILVALEPDALCACRILTTLFKRDFIGHKIQPVSGYDDLAKVGETLISKMKTQNGGAGGVVVCLGVGGLVDLSNILGLEDEGDGLNGAGGIDVWLIDARRPWNLGNVFAGDPRGVPGSHVGHENEDKSQVDRGEIQSTFRPGSGGVIVYDDGDITDDLQEERQAYCALLEMGDVDEAEGGYMSPDSDLEEDQEATLRIKNGITDNRKRKTWSGNEQDSDEEEQRPRRRRRSSSHASSSPHRQVSVESGTFFRERSSSSRVNESPTVQVASSAPEGISERAMRKKFWRDRRKYNGICHRYYNSGAAYSEPISSILYSLSGELGRDDNNILWHAIVGISSLELYGRSLTGVGISTSSDAGGSAGWGGLKGEGLRRELRDEVRRLNPLDESDARREELRGEATGTIATTARSPNDHAIRVSPEPRFLMIRHWSLYDSMLHSPYLGSRLHIWSEQGRKRLHKLLAKMGVSLSQCKQSYTHMDMELKRGLRQRLLTYAPQYSLDGLVPPQSRTREGWGFIRCWGWRGCFSALDVGVILGAILEVGKAGIDRTDGGYRRDYHSRTVNNTTEDHAGLLESEEWVHRFWEAYDALENVDALKQSLPLAQHLHRAIIRTGTTIIEKRQIRHLKAFRIAVVKEGPDVALFTHPGALTKLALWVGEAVAEQERTQRGEVGKGGKPTPLVMASLYESRGIYVVVGTGGGGGVVDFAARARRKERIEDKARRKREKQTEKESRRQERRAERREVVGISDEEEESEEEDDDDDDDDSDESDGDLEDQGYGRNRFGNAFQEVVDETNARVRIDSFEHCVVEVKKEDLSQFLESLSMKVVSG